MLGRSRRRLLFHIYGLRSNMQSRVAEGLALVQARVEAVRTALSTTRPVRLVAVSKLKPPELVREAYALGHRVFGENYVEELVEKAQTCPADISWHLIGHLQSNKVKKLLQVRNLEVVETVDSEKLAERLNKECGKIGRPPLRIFLQVDTSDEPTKSGIDPPQVPTVASYIFQNCPNLVLSGLMTIGKAQDITAFDHLRSIRDSLCASLGVQELELSMGMSADFEDAIRAGSTNIRVGSTIFGDR